MYHVIYSMLGYGMPDVAELPPPPIDDDHPTTVLNRLSDDQQRNFWMENRQLEVEFDTVGMPCHVASMTSS